MVLGALAAIAVVWALVVGAVWAYAWLRLGPDDVPALRDDVTALGTRGSSAPADATTILVSFTGAVDPTVPRPSPLDGPVALVQFGGPRDEPAVLLLPSELTVTVDGVGTLSLEEVQLQGGLDLLTRAVVDYSQVRVDHAVALSVDALPALVDAVDELEVCGAGGCSRPTGDEVRVRLATGDDLDRARVVAEVARSLSLALDRTWAARSPLQAKRVVDVLAREVTTDASLRGGRLLAIAAAIATPVRLDTDTVPMVQNPATGEVVAMEEPTEVRFQRLREGAPLAVGDAPQQDLEAELIAEVEVAVLNAAGIDGLAGRVRVELEARGFVVIGTGNAPSFDRAGTVVSYAGEDETVAFVAGRLAEALGGATLEPNDQAPTFEGEPVDVLVLVGQDLAG